MEKFIKKLIAKFSRSSSPDPAKIFPQKVFENILIHLSGNDVLRCSMVNRDWNRVVALSNRSIERLRLCIFEPYFGMIREFTSSDVRCIISSGRKYKHLSMSVTKNLTKDHLLLMASFQWETLTFCNHTFKSEIELINFLGLIEPWIVELNLRSIRIVFSKKQEIAITNFLFPKLRKLKLSNCYSYLHAIIFNQVELLQYFEIETISNASDFENEFFDRVKGIQKMLIRNPHITNLTLNLHQKDFDDIFIDERFLSRIRFHLECLRTKRFRKLTGISTNIVQINNFAKFIHSHKYSLTSLQMMDYLGNDVLETVINSLNKLIFLAIEDLDSYGKIHDSIANMTLFKNESITKLHLMAKFSKYNELQKVILQMLPNLEWLSIGTVNQEILETIIEKNTKIQGIDVDHFVAYNPPDRKVLHDIEIIRINESYAKNFKDILRDCDYYTNFEEVFLSAVKYFHNQGYDLIEEFVEFQG